MFILQITVEQQAPGGMPAPQQPVQQRGAFDDAIDALNRHVPSRQPTPPREERGAFDDALGVPRNNTNSDTYVSYVPSTDNGRTGPTIVQAAAPVAVASRHAISTGVLAESWASLRAAGSVANSHIADRFINITRLEDAYNGLANTRLGKIPYIGNSLSRAFGWTSRLFTSGTLNYGVRTAGLLEKIPRYGLPLTRGLGFVGGRALPILGAGIAAFDCGRDIYRCFNPPQGQSRGVAIANTAVNVGCTATGAVIGGIIGSAVPVVGTFIGACIGAGIGNLVGNVVKSAITPGGLLNRFGRWLFGA